jgi:parallel beta-helix repeat protein
MNRNHVHSLALGFILLGVFGLAIGIQRVEASGTVYIKADGTVYPPTAPIQYLGNEYSFSGNITDTLVVEKDSIVIDGEGYYLLGTGATYSSGVDLSGRFDVTVRNLFVDNFWWGIKLDESSSYCKILQNHISSNDVGVRCYGSNNIIKGNDVVGPAQYYGIAVVTGSSNLIEENIIDLKHTGYGIHMQHAGTNNHAFRNSIVNCNQGYHVLECQSLRFEENNLTNNANYGILLEHLNSSTIAGNNIRGSTNGIRMSGYENTIFSNNIENCSTGVWIAYSADNLFYHNNFRNNTVHVYTNDLYDAWDNGYPSGGNYWDNYTGIDGNGDGIGDTPYVISGYNIDRYPLMEPVIISEFPSFLILPLFMIATLLTAIVYKRKRIVVK